MLIGFIARANNAICHSRASGNPRLCQLPKWIPACAGMTRWGRRDKVGWLGRRGGWQCGAERRRRGSYAEVALRLHRGAEVAQKLRKRRKRITQLPKKADKQHACGLQGINGLKGAWGLVAGGLQLSAMVCNLLLQFAAALCCWQWAVRCSVAGSSPGSAGAGWAGAWFVSRFCAAQCSRVCCFLCCFLFMRADCLA